jgi:hypothetical protein
MRGSLSGVRTRVDRLAARLRLSARAGCHECRDKEQQPKIVVFYGSDAPDVPGESRCEACDRVIPYQYELVGYDANMKPTDME